MSNNRVGHQAMSRIAAGVIMAMTASAAANDMTGLTASANGYTWTYTLFDGNTAGLTACSPEPTGKLMIPGGLDVEVWKNGALITHVPVSSIEKACFEGCTGIMSVEFPNTTSFYHVRANAFSGCTGLAEVKMNTSLASIGKEAFKNCTSLTEVTIPEGIGSIGDSSFSGCSSLVRMSLPLTALTTFYYGNEICAHVGSLFGTTSYEGGVLRRQRSKSGSVTTYYFPESLSEITATGIAIPGVAFNFNDDAPWLTKLTIKDKVKRIGPRAFGNCSSLTRISIPSSVTYVGQEAFSGSGIKSVIVGGGDLDMWAFAYCYGLESIILKEGVTSIAYDAFDECTNLVSVVIPNSVTNIGNAAFEKCYNLKSATLGSGITSISSSLFNTCSALENVVVAGNVTSISEKAFYCCKALTDVVFHGDAPTVGSRAFYSVPSDCSIYVRYGSTGWGDGDTWQGLRLKYYGANVSSGTATEIDGGYSISATGGARLTESDITITAVAGSNVVPTTVGYVVEIADDGQSATVTLRKPEIATQTASDVEGDRTGALVIAEEDVISAKPETDEGDELAAIAVHTVPGLFYQASWGSELGCLSAGQKVQATGDTLYLGVIKQTGSSGFYKVTVSDR